MAKVSVAEARGKFSEVVGRAAFGRERIVVQRRGKPVAAVVSIEDLEKLEQLEDQEALQELLRAKELNEEFLTLERVEAEYLESRRKCGRRTKSK